MTHEEAQALGELLGLQCEPHPGYCNGENVVECILGTDVIVTQQNVDDACTALTVPGIEIVLCAKDCC